MKLSALLVLVALLSPMASAQMPSIARAGPVSMEFVDTIAAELRADSVDMETVPFDPQWLLAGHDNPLNLTIRNFNAAPLNVTMRLNATGATATPDVVTLVVPPMGASSARVMVRPLDVGIVRIEAVADDAFQSGGTPLTTQYSAVSTTAPSVRVIDPSPPVQTGEDADLRRVDSYGGFAPPSSQAFVRVQAGEGVVVRLEARNDLLTATPAMQVTAIAPGKELGPVEIPSLEPGESRTVEFPEYVAIDQAFGDGPRFGPSGRFDLRFTARVALAGIEASIGLAGYDIEAGAVKTITPATVAIEVQDGVAVDLLVPKNPTLGVPTRVKFNVSNNGRAPATGNMMVSLQTPGNLFYEVQGPETKSVHVQLAPGESIQGVIEWTPRVTGTWVVQPTFYSTEGFGFGGGGGSMNVEGPLTILSDTRGGTIYARIGEPIEVDLSVTTTRALSDAQMRVTSGSPRYSDAGRSGGGQVGEYRPGLQQDLLDVGAPSADLATLRPGGVLNTTLELVGRSAGRYSVVAYVIAEGFAYTSTTPTQPGAAVSQPVFYDPFGGEHSIQVAVQPRPLPSAFAILPLVVGLTVFVGAWTMRTRFVK